MDHVLYSLRDVGVCYKHWSLFHRSKTENWALRHINLDIYEGENIGIIGHNGAGKTTILRLLSNILYCDEGTFECHASSATMLSIGAGFDNYLTGRENIGLNGRLLGMSPREIKTRENEIISLSGLQDFIDRPILTYSTGMRMRLGFSIAYYANPAVLLLDENLGVGDIQFQKKSTALIKEKLLAKTQTSIIVSHSVELIRGVCSRVIWIDNGTIRATGEPQAITAEYLCNVAKK